MLRQDQVGGSRRYPVAEKTPPQGDKAPDLKPENPLGKSLSREFSDEEVSKMSWTELRDAGFHQEM